MTLNGLLKTGRSFCLFTASIVYALIALLMDSTHLVYIRYTLTYFHGFLVVMIGFCLYFIVRAVWRGNKQAKIILWGFIALSVTAVFDIVNIFYLNISWASRKFTITW